MRLAYQLLLAMRPSNCLTAAALWNSKASPHDGLVLHRRMRERRRLRFDGLVIGAVTTDTQDMTMIESHRSQQMHTVQVQARIEYQPKDVRQRMTVEAAMAAIIKPRLYEGLKSTAPVTVPKQMLQRTTPLPA